ncbi:hypothetical protein PYW08_003499 [Mythimna loreyi]|uniref:Uncharacterized protein n=1 Tax=Mythimna loreyi TaxID=667449 RepID=A0ACC2QTY4_9NEOP|nr:hypothetical protein PYW08_003499 [Mythimna loreyi]
MCARAAPALLAHVNLLLTLYGGAALATAARLKWDPSTYLVLRELFPAEYRAAAAALTAAGGALLLLPHLGAAALHALRPRSRTLLLYLYAGLMTLLMVCELVFGGWLAAQALAWQRSPAAQQLREALELREHLRPVMQYFGRWYPLPHRIEELVKEAQEDAPRNAYVALALVALLALLQLAAVVAALMAREPPAPRVRAASLAGSDSELPLQPRPPSYNSSPSYDYQKMPRTAFRNGRIVILEPARA